ncbi:MAG: hypothetical protein CMA63_05460 [Euryarchaeota archaeon]|nr:hypothetical protein [Euryarchaeota archaeon]
MPRETAPRRTSLALAMILMFLFADLLVPQTFNTVPELEEQYTISYVTSTDSALNDTFIQDSNPSSNYNISTDGFLGVSDTGSESRLLFEFPMNFSSSDTVQSATLNLECTVESVVSTNIAVYAAMSSSWNAESVTWMESDMGTPWETSGADGSNDRSFWEPPFRTSVNGTFAVNVTSFAQQAAADNATSLSLVVSAVGSEYECVMSDSLQTADHPELVFVTTANAPGNGGSVTSNFVDDGAALMSDDFILAADRTPTLSYTMLTGSDVEYQLSLDASFKSPMDLTWHYSTLWNSFSTSGSSGTYDIPATEQFDNGTEVFYRVRSVDATGTLSTWESASFLLPSHDVIDNGDGTATIEVDIDDLGLPSDFIEDTYVNQQSKNTKYGDIDTLETSVTSNKESLIHVRMMMEQIGLPANATIVEANLDLTRDTSANNAVLSMHEMSPDQWIEDEANWNRRSNGNIWQDGGREFSSTASATGIDGSQTSSDFSFAFTDVLQKWLQSGTSDSTDFMITARGQNEAFPTTGTVSTSFFSSQVSDDAKKPQVSITYTWGQTSPLTNVTLQSPSMGEAVWNQSGHNFSANTTPSITWAPLTVNYDMVLQLSTDEQFRNRVWVSNTGTDNEFTATDGIINLTGSQALTAGNMYFWRMAYMDSDGQYGPWSTSKFLVSSLESTWLGGDRYEFRMKHGNGTTDGLYPECLDTFIDSGTPNQNYNDESKLLIAYNTYPSEAMGLLSCDLRSNLLPAGYAVESAHLSMMVGSTPYNSPKVAVWESTQQNWSDSGATWTSYDGVNAWNTAGGKGTARSSLLDSVQLNSSFSDGDRVEWNVTLGVQNAMRENRSADFQIGILGVGVGQSREVQLYPGRAEDSEKPELRFVYVPGSNAVPNDPSPLMPLNGSWSMGTGVDQTPIRQPTIGWTFGSNLVVGGWAIQLDLSETFDSTNLITKTSWNDPGFDAPNLTFTPTTDLDDGVTWHWRVRAISTTNQIGNWSNSFHFLLPDLTTWQTCPDGSCASVELHHDGIMPELNIPTFVDTYVIESGAGATSSYNSSSQLKVGAVGFNRQAIGLIEIPLNAYPQPSSARVTGAEINLYSEFSSSTGEPIAIRPVLQSWTADANDTTYDGTNNWSQKGGRDLGVDLGPYVDLQSSVSADWMTFDVTEAVQAALGAGSSSLSLALYASNEITAYDNGPNIVIFTSTEGASSDRPWLNLTWSSGSGTVPITSGVNVAPTNNSYSWDTSSHELASEDTPQFTWSHASVVPVGAWRVHIFEDPDDDMAGRYTYDSRIDATSFDLPNLTFTPPSALTHNPTILWTVQPIQSGMIGQQSAPTLFHIPTPDAGYIDSTHAWASFQEGAYLESENYPQLTEDTVVDGGNTQNNAGNSGYLSVGRSPSNSLLRTSSLIEIDFSSLPLPSVYEVNNASLDLTVVAGSDEIFVSVSEMITTWDEASTWAHPGNNSTSWLGSGAYHSADSEIPETNGFWINGSSVYSINVTSLMQHAIERGQESLNIIIQAEEIDGTVDGTYYIASSEYSGVDDRPKLTMTYELTNPWSASSPTHLHPLDDSTLWNLSAPRPSGAETVSNNWSSSESNHTQWTICGSTDARMIQDLSCMDTDEIATGNYSNLSWDPSTLTVERLNPSKGDEWQYWRVRGDQDDRIGHWSEVQRFRVPDDQGVDDGDGNQSLALYRGSIFSETGMLPEAPDAEISSSSASTALGGSSFVNLGTSASGTGESQILMEFDLSDLPWPNAMTPTSMLLSMYRTGVVGTSATTVSVHACSSFTESSVTWNSNTSCSTSEITRSTLTLSPSSGWIDWDLTSLAQDNVANGNLTMTILLKSVGSSATNHRFHSSDSGTESLRPRLILEYVDNVNGIVPPAQPVQVSPLDGSILYNVSQSILMPDDKPVLTWSAVTGATGYIVTIANESGVNTYRSWEASEISGTTYRFADSLATGEVFTWWVQGVNQSIPGPSSSRWSFAIGDPLHTYNNDLTYTYTFQTGREVAQFGHTNIRETHLSEVSPTLNFGGSPTIELGTHFGANAGMESRLTFALDNNQVPLPAHANIHSASLGLYLDAWSISGGATEVTFNVHRILNTQWAQSSSTWNASSSSSSGAWGAPGMQAGVDYDATPISTFVDTDLSDGRWIWFDIGVNGMLIDNDNAWIIIASPNRGSLLGNFIASENVQETLRPTVLLNHTNASSISITPTSPTTDADTSVTFSESSYDHLGMAINAPITWSASNGSISQSGVFTPYATGQHTISACFGIMCSSEIVTVTPGQATTLVVSPESSTISADDTLLITAYAIDQFGNEVPGQSISFTPSNGSMDSFTDGLFIPHASGSQTVVVSWADSSGATQSVTVTIEVETGAPEYFELSGCSGEVPAGLLCAISHTLFDQFGNQIMDVTEAGDLTWTTNDGNYSESTSEYFPDHVGTWYLNLTSTSGAEATLMIVVGHGQMASLELIASSTSVTADDRVWINSTRIDVQGNRLPVLIPIDNWTKVSDGQLTPGAPAIWDPLSRGSKTLEARYETMTSQLTINVQEGSIVSLIMIVENEDSTWQMFDITADDILDVKVKATDQKGNRWSVNANWSLTHSDWTSQTALEQLQGDETTFVPYLSSSAPYSITATYDDGNMVHVVGVNITVSQGDLNSVSITATDAQGLTNTVFDITSDAHIDFTSALADVDTNAISSDILGWVLTNTDTGDSTDITALLLQNAMRWEASVVGNWSITAYAISDSGYNITDGITIEVHHGVAVSVAATLDTFEQDAGAEIKMSVTGTDADGNIFPQIVEWTQASVVVANISADLDEGSYVYLATTAGVHTLEYTAGQATNSVDVTVNPQQIVHSLVIDLSSQTIEQLGNFTVTVKAFDMYLNPIDLPPSANVDATGRAEVLNQGQGVWNIITLDDGPQTVTVTAGNVNEERTVQVEGNLGGFFKAGGPLYYVGAGLIGVVAIVLLALLVSALRGGDSDYDDDDDYSYEDQDEAPSGPAPGPTGPAPDAKPNPTSSDEPEDTSWQVDHRVDDDGTEWAQDQDGTWFYRQPNDTEWDEWTD